MKKSSPGRAKSQTDASIQTRIAHALPALTTAQIKMAEFTQAQMLRSATMSIEEFAKANDVSSATANRFARMLGFDKYSSFRACLMREFEKSMSPVARLRQAQADSRATDHKIIASALDMDIENLQATRQMLTSAECEHAVESIIHADRIFIVGMGTSAHLAGQFEYGLNPYCRNVQSLAVNAGSVGAARRLHDVTENDLLIAIMFPQYIYDTARLAHFGHKQGAKVLALTDGPTSPLASFADISLYLKTQRQFASNSDAIVLSTIQGLCGAVAYRQPNAADAAASMNAATQPWLLTSDTHHNFGRSGKKP
ncbi:MurR/RpiR family transcriptional regulator [Pusillimonas sp. SM2304]|uniref:MurR/RpiR family transcriptional regulator n=1 Tax=Pusillimonas sp. SM2304 TaxID=3073241 RepID=UPI0028772430|nr:MurR/RpiR family transcriptional regulator [Pusillimonas sp. SM2304]MDS1139031.1 MurR/RpiR family transcriptional regulator [Pusillimonas sp. SM2304]